MIGIKNYKRSCSFDFVSYHVFIISLHDFESKILTINHVFCGSRLPWGRSLSLLHVAWLSEGKLIVDVGTILYFIHLHICLSYLAVTYGHNWTTSWDTQTCFHFLIWASSQNSVWFQVKPLCMMGGEKRENYQEPSWVTFYSFQAIKLACHPSKIVGRRSEVLGQRQKAWLSL